MMRLTTMTAALAALAGLGACSSTRPVVSPATEAPVESARLERELREIEATTGGRLGVALYDGDGHWLGGHRADERFAMCSTFKYALSAMVLADSAVHRLPLEEKLTFHARDLVTYSPVVEPLLTGDVGAIRVADAARGAVTVSDNTAANLLLARIGGPEGYTARLRLWGDPVTRLDRVEPELNENAPGDPRDTTSPSAMASTLWRLVFGSVLPAAEREQLREWGRQTETGRARIRAGLPREWLAGDKTGTCGTAYNDVAWMETGDGRRFTLTVYLDRPTISSDEANAAIARVAAVAARSVAVR